MNDFSLFETMRYTPGEGIARLSLHLKRLETSARRLGFAGAEKAEEALATHLGIPPSVLPDISPSRGEIAGGAACTFDSNGNGEDERGPRPISLRAGEMSGRTEGGAPSQDRLRVRLELSPSGEISIISAPFVLQPEDTVWRIAIARTCTNSADTLLRHKTTRRALYEAARTEYPVETVNEVILLNEKGEVAEGTITNLFVAMEDGRLATPPLSSGCLAGVLRTSLICGKRAFNQRLRPDDLKDRPLYIGNSLRGLIRAELIEA
mgnify:CR=1 FL=1